MLEAKLSLWIQGLTLIVLTSRSFAGTELSDRAQEAANDGMWSLAAQLFTECQKEIGPETAEGRDANVLAAQALTYAGKPAEALARLKTTASPDAAFARGEALLALNRLGDALKAYTEVPAFSRQWDAALWKQARLLFRFGDEARTHDILALLSESKDRAWSLRALLWRAEILLDQDHPDRAAEYVLRAKKLVGGHVFFPLMWMECRLASERADWDEAGNWIKKLEGPDSPAFYQEGASVQGAARLTALGDDAEAARRLIALVEEHSDSVWLPVALQKLTNLPGEGGGMGMEKLAEWSGDSRQPLASLARFSLAERFESQKRLREALGLYLAVSESEAPVDFQKLALFRVCLIADSMGDDSSVKTYAAKLFEIETDHAVLSRVRFLFALEDTRDAAATARNFEEIIRTPQTEPQVRRAAVVNAILARLKANPSAMPSPKEYAGLAGVTRAQWMLEAGLYQIDADPKEGARMLVDYLRDYPSSPGSVRALLALAEDSLNSESPDRSQIEKWLLEAEKILLGGADSDLKIRWEVLRLRYLENDGKEGFVAAAEAFLTENPSGPEFEEISLRLARHYFEQEDFARAGKYFSSVAAVAANPKMRETALFFSAKASMALMNPVGYKEAIGLLEEAEKLKGPLGQECRLLRATLLVRLGDDAAGTSLLQSFLTDRGDEEIRFRAAQTLADVLMNGKAADSASRDRAVSLCRSFRDNASAPVGVRFRAARLMFLYLRTMNRAEEGNQQAYQLLRGLAPTTREDLMWRNQLALECAKALGTKGDWKAAVAVAEIAANSEGPLSSEAVEFVKTIRLRNEIWPDTVPATKH